MNGQDFRAKRKQLRLSQARLGRALGLHRNTISDIENGGEVPEKYRLLLLGYLADGVSR